MKLLLRCLLMMGGVGLLTQCQTLDRVTPPNPFLGQWTLTAWQVYHLPTWYAQKTNDIPFITATDTIYAGPAPQFFNVKSLTFSAGGNFSETYYQPPGYVQQRTLKTDYGQSTFMDSVATLSISNDFPHKLIYRAATSQLVTDIHPKTSIIQFLGDSADTISYSIRLYYSKLP